MDDLASVFDRSVDVVVGLVSLLALARFILWYMDKLVDRTMVRNEHLETRLEDLERRLSEEIDGHRSCREELIQHKIEAAGKMAEMATQIDLLTKQVNRPRRCTDPPEGEQQ